MSAAAVLRWDPSPDPANSRVLAASSSPGLGTREEAWKSGLQPRKVARMARMSSSRATQALQKPAEPFWPQRIISSWGSTRPRPTSGLTGVPAQGPGLVLTAHWKTSAGLVPAGDRTFPCWEAAHGSPAPFPRERLLKTIGQTPRDTQEAAPALLQAAPHPTRDPEPQG